jgi:hypothetical protein
MNLIPRTENQFFLEHLNIDFELTKQIILDNLN